MSAFRIKFIHFVCVYTDVVYKIYSLAVGFSLVLYGHTNKCLPLTTHTHRSDICEIELDTFCGVQVQNARHKYIDGKKIRAFIYMHSGDIKSRPDKYRNHKYTHT